MKARRASGKRDASWGLDKEGYFGVVRNAVESAGVVRKEV
jgi:hypothetical protein